MALLHDQWREEHNRREREALAVYTMLLNQRDRTKRRRIIEAGLSANVPRERIDADLKRFGIESHGQ